MSRFIESPNRSMHDGERECESASDSPGWATPAVLRPRVLALCRKRPDAFAAQRQHAFPHFDTTSSSPARIAPGGDTAPRESRAELGRYAWAHICSLSLTGCLFWMRRNVRQRAEDPGAVDVEDGVPPPRAAPPLLRRVVLSQSSTSCACRRCCPGHERRAGVFLSEVRTARRRVSNSSLLQ